MRDAVSLIVVPEMLPHSDRFVSLCPKWFQLRDPGLARCLLGRIDYRWLKRLCHTCRRNAYCRVVCNVLICISRQFCRLIRGSDECWPGCYIWELAYFSIWHKGFLVCISCLFSFQAHQFRMWHICSAAAGSCFIGLTRCALYGRPDRLENVECFFWNAVLLIHSTVGEPDEILCSYLFFGCSICSLFQVACGERPALMLCCLCGEQFGLIADLFCCTRSVPNYVILTLLYAWRRLSLRALL
jgi:hypothetical protein